MKLPPTRKTRNLHASQYFSMLLSMLPMDHPFALTTTLVVGLLVPFFFIWSLRMNSIASILSKWISQWAFPRMDDSSIVGTGPYYDSSLLQSLKILESNWELIQREVDTKLMPQLDHLYSLNRHLKPTEHTDTIAQSQQQQQERQVPLDRKAFFFSIFGYSFESSRQYCPETTAVLDTIPGVRVAFVSILAPQYKTRITLHAGQWNKGLVRCHLGLKVPSSSNDSQKEEEEPCRITVGGETMSWQVGKMLCFDEMSPHEAWNESNDYRVILIVDVLRPLKFPMNLVNWLYLELIVQTTKIRLQ